MKWISFKQEPPPINVWVLFRSPYVAQPSHAPYIVGYLTPEDTVFLDKGGTVSQLNMCKWFWTFITD